MENQVKQLSREELEGMKPLQLVNLAKKAGAHQKGMTSLQMIDVILQAQSVTSTQSDVEELSQEDDEAADGHVRPSFSSMLTFLWAWALGKIATPIGERALDFAAACLNQDEPLDVEATGSRWQWVSRVLRRSPAVATDAHGWYSAEVCQDGSMAITIHAAPNLLNRQAGAAHSQDMTVRIKNVPEFLVLLGSAYVQGMEIVEEDEDAMQDEEEWQIEQVRLAEDEPADAKADPVQAKIRAMAEHLGLQELPDSQVITAIAEACGVLRNENETQNQFIDRLGDEFDKHVEEGTV